MKSIKIKDIEVLYDESVEEEIDYIQNVINNNYSLFTMVLEDKLTISLIPMDREGVIQITDFDDFFRQIVNDVYQNEYNREQFANEDVLPGLYLEYLIRKSSKDKKTLVDSTFNFDDPMLYSFIAYKYYEENGTFEDFIEYLKDRKNTDKILLWLQTNNCFNAYNYLLKITVNFLTSNDFGFLHKINHIISKMLKEIFNDILNGTDKEKTELPKISKEELDNLFINFLHYINAPKSWFQIYQKLKDDNLIDIIIDTDGEDNSKCYKDDSDILRIMITTDETIGGFLSLVHEFCHYIELQDDINTASFSISEFPSIFFEKLAAIFLAYKGYPQNVIDEATKFRKENNIDIYASLSMLFIDIIKYSKEGHISREEKIKFHEEQFRILRETREKLMEIEIKDGFTPNSEEYKMPDYDIEKLVDQECEELVTCFVQNGLLVLNGYQYLFGTFLAEEILNLSSEDPTIISKMIMITNKFSEMDLQKILNILGIEDIFDEDPPSKKGNARVRELPKPKPV